MLLRRALAGTLTPAVATRGGKAAPTVNLIRGIVAADPVWIAELLRGEAGKRA